MTQWCKHFGCHRGDKRRSVRRPSIAPASAYFGYSLVSMDTRGVIAPSGPPG